MSAAPSPAGAAAWIRRNLFAGWASGLATLAIGAIALSVLPGLVEWALLRAVFRPDPEACRALEGAGACWGVIAEKHRLILFGRYPHAEHGRALAASLLLVALLAASAVPRLWRPPLLAAWAAGLAAAFMLMRGGLFGLVPVEPARWGGLPLTLMLATLSLAAAFPLAVLLALGRRSRLPALRALCVAYIELVRGVPLIAVLFMASFMFPLLLPPDVSVDVLLRVLGGIALFAAAYLAEVVRGGLQAIPAGQYDAARALGMSEWQVQRLVVLPQALRAVVPAVMNSFIGTLKDTSLVTIVSLYELTGSLSLALAGDPEWRPFYLEGYLFIGLIYWSACFALSRYSRRVEARLHAGTRRLGA